MLQNPLIQLWLVLAGYILLITRHILLITSNFISTTYCICNVVNSTQCLSIWLSLFNILKSSVLSLQFSVCVPSFNTFHCRRRFIVNCIKLHGSKITWRQNKTAMVKKRHQSYGTEMWQVEQPKEVAETWRILFDVHKCEMLQVVHKYVVFKYSVVQLKSGYIEKYCIYKSREV